MTTLTGRWSWGPATILGVDGVSSDVGTYTLDDSNDSVRTRFVAPKDGTLDRIGIYIDSITGNPPAYSVGFWDMAEVAYGGSTAEEYDFTATGWVWVTLAAPATAAAGDLIDAIIQPTGSAPDASNCATVRVQAIPLSTRMPIAAYRSTGWNSSAPGVAAMYSDGSLAIPGGVSRRLNMDTDTTPDEGGALFQVPFDCKCIGAQILLYPISSSGDYTVKLYSAADALLGSVTMDSTYANGVGVYLVNWDEVSLAASTNYRITVLPTTATNVYLTVMYQADVASRQWWPEGERWQLTERTDAGGWTETNTAVPMIALRLSEITLPEAGGGGAAWSGGMIIG